MFSIFDKGSERMCDYLKNIVGQEGKEFDICKVYSKYAMDVIASCAFGVDSKSFDVGIENMSKFEEMGNKFLVGFDPLILLKYVLVHIAPKLAEKFGVEVLEQGPQNYFEMVIKEVMKHRRENNLRQEDFLQLMMDMQAGNLKNDAGEEEDSNFKLELENDDIIANCMMFLAGGYDTVQSLLIYAAYALAMEPEVQEELRREVEKTMEENGGKFKLTYEAVHEMPYMDMFVNETLRLYPPSIRTERECTKEYKVPGTDVVIEKGLLVNLPVIGIHRNPEYYENPEKFNTENFISENANKRHPFAFVPFGKGPRICIGMRFALTEAKAVIATLVHNFKLEPCSKTDIPMKYSNSATLKPVNGLWLRITPRYSQ